MSLKHVSSGQKFQMPASTFNAFVDAAQAHQNRKGFNEGQSGSHNFRLIKVKNDSGGALDQFEILGIDEPIITPTDNADEYKSRVTVVGVTPDDGTGGSGSVDHTGRFVVIQEPIPSGFIGDGLLSGETLVKINVVSEDDEFADIKVDETGYLESSSTGTARILWKESGTGVKNALVRLGDSAGGGGGEILAYKTTSAVSAGYVDAKRVKYDGTVGTEAATSFRVFTG